jgi:hypothetical protein
MVGLLSFSERVPRGIAAPAGYACIGLLALGLWSCGSPAPATSPNSPAPAAAAAAAFPEAAAVEPPAAAAEPAAQAQATAVAQAALAAAQVRSAARGAYSIRAQRQLQRYADALGGLKQSTREAGERPALLRDAVWRTRTAAALGWMQAAADELTALGPVPQEMAAAAELFGQLAGETRLLGEDHARGIDAADNGEATSTAPATTRMNRITDVALRANIEVRRVLP